MFTIIIFVLFYIKADVAIVELFNIIFIIDFILIGGILPLVERKYLALMQRRVGPKFVGYKGRLQFIADALKIFFKDYFFLFRSNKYMFYILPMIFFNINLYFLYNMVWCNNYFVVDIEMNVLSMLILSAISNFFVFLTAYYSRNKYSVIAASRIASIFFINELMLTIIICQYVFWCNSFSFSVFMNMQDYLPGIYIFCLYLPTLIYVFMMDVSRVPFDFSESESELIMGYTNEYTGFLFGVYTLVEYLHIYFFSYFLVLLLWW